MTRTVPVTRTRTPARRPGSLSAALRQPGPPRRWLTRRFDSGGESERLSAAVTVQAPSQAHRRAAQPGPGRACEPGPRASLSRGPSHGPGPAAWSRLPRRPSQSGPGPSLLLVAGTVGQCPPAPALPGPVGLPAARNRRLGGPGGWQRPLVTGVSCSNNYPSRSCKMGDHAF